jgi:hypothetical protein
LTAVTIGLVLATTGAVAEALAGDERVDAGTAERLRGLYEDRLDRLTERMESDGAAPDRIDQHATIRRVR